MSSSKSVSAVAFLLAIPFAIFAQGFDIRGGSGAVAITPLGFSSSNISSINSSNSFSMKTESRAIALEKAKEILQNTNIIMSPKEAEGGVVSEQTLAFASLLHYVHKSTAKLNAQMIYNFAKTDEARVYGLMALFRFSKNEYDSILAKIDSNKEVNTLFGGKFRRMKISEFFVAFNRDPSQFFPSSDILKTTVRVEQNSSPIIYVAPRHRVIHHCPHSRPNLQHNRPPRSPSPRGG